VSITALNGPVELPPATSILLVVLALFDRLQGKYDLHCLTPKSGFISVQALEDAAVQVRKTQKAVGQLPRRPTIIMIDSLEAVRSILLVVASSPLPR
jgi:hypothetical protein